MAEKIFDRQRVPRATVLAVLSCLVLVPLAIAFLDRDIASWSFGHFHGQNDPFILMSKLAEWLQWAAGLWVLACGLAFLAGWRPGRIARILLVAALAAFVSATIKDQLKFLCGRTWPETWTNNNPSWIGNGVFGFFPLHGGAGWGSFPSGHTTVTAAPMAVLARAFPRWVALCCLPVLVVALGLLGADHHFLGDILAGAYLGTACGLVLAALTGIGRQDAAPPLP